MGAKRLSLIFYLSPLSKNQRVYQVNENAGWKKRKKG